MKFLCTLLAFLVLTLSLQPVCAAVVQPDKCCMADGGCEGQDEGTGSDDCNKSCNPFQLCSCCAFAVVVPYMPAPIIQAVVKQPALHTTFFQCTIADGSAKDFWQPPRA